MSNQNSFVFIQSHKISEKLHFIGHSCWLYTVIHNFRIIIVLFHCFCKIFAIMLNNLLFCIKFYEKFSVLKKTLEFKLQNTYQLCNILFEDSLPKSFHHLLDQFFLQPHHNHLVQYHTCMNCIRHLLDLY